MNRKRNNSLLRKLRNSCLKQKNYRGTFITSQSSEFLSVKRTEQVHVPCSRLVDPSIDVVEVIRSVVQDFGDDEGAFPGRGKFVRFLLIHAEDQISFLKGSTLHISGVKPTQLLMVDGRAD